MSDFVDYNKRSIDLPSGCKNLADVLQTKPIPIRGDVQYAKLSEIGSYIARAWHSDATNVYLSIKPKLAVISDGALHFNVKRGPDKTSQAIFEAQMGSAIGVSLTRFMQKHGYKVPDDSVPDHFSPHLPVEMICDIFPLPTDAFQLAALVLTIFRQVCELADDAPMTIFFVERS